jgi:surface protein
MASSSTLKSVDLSNLDTSEVTNANHMFFHDTALESADLSGWNLNNASNLSYMFLDDDNLKSLNISNWQLKDGVNTTFAFGYRDNLSSLTDFNVNGVKNLNKNVLKTYLNVVKKNGATSVDLSSTTLSSSVTDLQLAFANLPNVKSINLSGWDTSHVTNVYAAFAFDSALTDVNLSGWNLSGTDSIKSLFYQDSNLTNVDLSNVDFGTNLIDETYAFQGASSKLANVNLKGAKNVPESVLKAYVTAAKNSKATSLDLSNVSLSDKITSFRSLFQNLSSLQTINLTGWKTSKITDMSYMFYNDQNLKEIKGLDTWDTSNVTDMSRMFYNDQNLKEIKGIDGWKTGSVTDMSYMFANNYSLKELNLSKWDVSKVGTKNDSKNFSLACMFADDFSLTSVGIFIIGILKMFIALGICSMAQ